MGGVGRRGVVGEELAPRTCFWGEGGCVCREFPLEEGAGKAFPRGVPGPVLGMVSYSKGVSRGVCKVSRD